MPTPSFDEIYNTGRAEALINRPDLFFAEGDITDIFNLAATAASELAIARAEELFRRTFLDGAFGQDLTELVFDRSNIVRSPATAATVDLTLTRPSAGGGEPAGTIVAGSVFSTEPDSAGVRVEFTTNVDVSWTATEVSSKIVPATAVNVGVAGVTNAGTITSIVSNVFDSTITVNNSFRSAGGNEEETDEALVARVRNFSANLARGTLPALRFAALSVPSVRIATPISDPATGIVTLYVTDDSGASSSQMVSDVIAILGDFEAGGAVVNVSGGSVFIQDINMQLTVRPGTNITELVPRVQTAIASRIARLDIGETLRTESIQAVAFLVDPINVTGAAILNPLVDVQPNANELIRAGVVSIT